VSSGKFILCVHAVFSVLVEKGAELFNLIEFNLISLFYYLQRV
jgi:hypothetical protein